MTPGPLRQVARRDDARRARFGSRWTYSLALLFGLLPPALGMASIWLFEETGAFWPEAIPPHVEYLGEYYHCMDLGAPDMRGLTVQGHTIGGGLIYARPPIGGKASAGFVVVTDGHRTQTCVDGG